MTPEEELAAQKRKLAALAQLEAEGQSIDNLTTDDVSLVAEPDAPPRLRLGAPLPGVPDSKPNVDAELLAARDSDVDAFNQRARETAYRQIVAGLTRRQAPESISPLGNAESTLLTGRRNAKLDALREMEANNGRLRTEATVDNAHQQLPLAREKLDLQKKEADDRSARDKAELALKQAEAERKRQQDALRAKRAVVPPGGNSKTATELRKEFNALPDVRTFGEIDASYRKIQQAAEHDSPAGDLALITGFMKIIDPGSSVKENEFANAQNAGGVPDKIRAQYNSLLNGERLSPSQRDDFVKQSLVLYDVHKSRYDTQAERYRALATKANAAPDDVTGRVDPQPKAPAPAAAASVPPASGLVTLVDESGEEFDFPAAKVDAILKAQPKLRRK